MITALQRNLRTLHETSDLMSLEDQIAPVAEIFRLQNTEELRQSERLYFPALDDEPTKALVLAATRGHFGKLVEDRPQCMLYLQGKPVLTWHIEAFNRQGIKEIGVVRGYRKEAVNLSGLSYFDNDDFESTGELHSLYKAREFLTGNVLIAYGDILFDNSILQYLLSQRFDIAIAADASFRHHGRSSVKRMMVSTTGTISPLMGEDGCRLTGIGQAEEKADVTGEWVGLLSLRGEGTERVVALLDELAESDPETLRSAGLEELLGLMINQGFEVKVRHTYGHWRQLKEQSDLSAGEVC